MKKSYIAVSVFMIFMLSSFVNADILAENSKSTPSYYQITQSPTTPFVYAENYKLVYLNEKGKYVEIKRSGNYAFEGERMIADVFVRNLLGKYDTKVYVTVGPSQGTGNDIETICTPNLKLNKIPKPLSSMLGRFNKETDMWYKCEFVVETADSMYGEYWIGYEAENSNGLLGYFGSWYYFLNPIIALSLDGDLDFDYVTPGTSSYSSTLLLGNDGDVGSGVMLDMFITGTDFYDSSSSDAICPVGNVLGLENLLYFASNGDYSTIKNKGADKDGYSPIGKGDYFGSINYRSNRIIDSDEGNSLAPGSEMAIKFRLDVPSPCKGNFDTGSIYFWARVSGDNPNGVPSVGLGITPEIIVA